MTELYAARGFSAAAHPTHHVGASRHVPSPPAIMTNHDFAFVPRPVVLVRNRQYVLLDDLRPALGVQLLAAADLTSLTATSEHHHEEATMPVWYDGSGVCYVRHGASAPRRLPVTDLPLWIGLDLRGGIGQLLMPA